MGLACFPSGVISRLAGLGLNYLNQPGLWQICVSHMELSHGDAASAPSFLNNCSLILIPQAHKNTHMSITGGC